MTLLRFAIAAIIALHHFPVCECGGNQWPSEYPELDINGMRDELCPFDLKDVCYVYGTKDGDSELQHEVLNGMIDCDHKKFDKSISTLRLQFFGGIFERRSCEVKNVVRVLCKKPPKQGDANSNELKEYQKQSRFLFLPTTSLKASRNGKHFNRLQNKLSTLLLKFQEVGGRQAAQTRDFKQLPSAFSEYLETYLLRMYTTGKGWKMDDAQFDYKATKTLYDSSIKSKAAQIVADAQSLWDAAFRCLLFSCSPRSNAILYYGDKYKRSGLFLSTDQSCLHKASSCSKSKFLKDQSKMNKWSPANFAFVEVESAYRVKYAAPWRTKCSQQKQDCIPSDYEPTSPSIESKKYVSNAMAMTSSVIKVPFELIPKEDVPSNADAKRRGFVEDPLENLESDGRVKFMGDTRMTRVFQLSGRRSYDMQIEKRIDDDLQIQPILPPLSEIQITFISRYWRFCSVKQFGAQQPLSFYAQPPDLIFFDVFKKTDEHGIWQSEVKSALHRFRPKMAEKTEFRLYPNCGDSTGKTLLDNENICDFVYFFDASRISEAEIEKWNGDEFEPQIEDKYQYLLLKASRNKKLQLGILADPELGGGASITVNFGLQSNDWMTVALLPHPIVIESKHFALDDAKKAVKIIAPNFDEQEEASGSGQKLQQGQMQCYRFRVKINKKRMKKKQIPRNKIYLRPIIFPTKKTVKTWKKDGFEVKDECTDGIKLLTKNEKENEVDPAVPGLMYIQLSQIDNYENGEPDFGSFCINAKLYGTYHVFYEIGSDSWYNRDQHLIQFDGTLQFVKSMYPIQSSSSWVQQERNLGKKDLANCWTNKKGFYAGKGDGYFIQNSLLQTRSKFTSMIRQYIEVEKPGAVSFEIREFPAPLKIGETTDWIVMHVSRKPLRGDFMLEPYCDSEKNLQFEFEDSTAPYFELDSVQTKDADAVDDDDDGSKKTKDGGSNLQPFSFKFRITAPKSLQCYGHYPYKIQWKVKQKVFQLFNDKVNKPTPVFLMVIAADFGSMDVHDTGTEEMLKNQEEAQANTYEDGLADPKCVEKYATRKQEEEDVGAKGPDGLLAPPLQFNERGDGTDAVIDKLDSASLQPVTFSKTIQNPAELNEYLNDYDRLKRILCARQPEHQICGGAADNKSADNSTEQESERPTASPTVTPPKPLPFWAWQNIVVYIACVVDVLGVVYLCGCCQKGLASKVVEAQQRAMEPFMEASDEEDEE